jgi:hypothetical protein
MSRTYCPRCHNTGQLTVVHEDPETSLWYRDTEPCTCVRPSWPWWLLAGAALVAGLMPAIVAGLR